MSYHPLVKSALLAALLLFVSKASADDQLRLRGVSDPNPVNVERGPKQDLDHQAELPYHQDIHRPTLRSVNLP